MSRYDINWRGGYNFNMMTNSKKGKINLYDLSRDEVNTLLDEWGFSAYHATRLWHHLYREHARTLEDITNLRPDLLTLLQSQTILEPLPVQVATNSSDGFTRKFLLGLADGEEIETVLMLFKERATACVSTQAGCAMGCVFCATGQMGFSRHLSPGEIVGQVLHIMRLQQEQNNPLRNVVFMGMGEPLHNYEATMKALDILTDHHGLALAPKHITISTVGIVPGIKRLANEGRPFNLAVSLHGATDGERQALVPPARRWPLEALMETCRYYSEKSGRRIFFEWTPIAGENDTAEQAHALGHLLESMEAHVNLIPLNPTQGYDGLPADAERARAFQEILAGYGLPSTVRQRRGIDIAAGCGQLRATTH
jgi:23S rRNA (adenine2503-C2)-methyltransferase